MGVGPEERDIKYNAKVDISEAVRNLRDLERKVDKLGDMADQGERMKGGFLSTKQVQLYRRILAEMEQDKRKHTEKLQRMEEKLSETTEREEFKKLKAYEDTVKKRTEMLRRAEGGNKWGDVASPAVQEFHRIKLDEAKDNLTEYEKSPELKGAQSETQQLETEVAKMTKVMEDFNAQMGRGGQHSGRIDNLREADPNVDKLIDGISTAMASTGIITGIGMYANYTNKGIDGLRDQEKSAYGVSQKLNSGMSDDELRESSQPIGEAHSYSIDQTLATQNIIARGGITDVNKLNDDTDTVQKFSRAYATDPNTMAHDGSLLRKMGALDEGQMDKFARLIGGQVAKNGNLGGREEEVQRATMALAQTVSQGMDKLTTGQLENLSGMQADVAQVKGLEGERGASAIADMDSAIKGGGHEMELLMGKGTKYTSLEDMNDLKFQMEKGMADPTNIQTILQTQDTMFGGNEAITESALVGQGMMTHHVYRALKEKGVLDKWKQGDFNTDEELKDLGDIEGGQDFLDKYEQWGETQTSQWEDNKAQNRNLNTDHSKAAEETATTSNSLWHKIPEPLQHGILPAMALGGGMLAGSLLKAGANAIRPTVGGGPGPLSKAGALGKKALKAVPKVAGKLAGPLAFLGAAKAGDTGVNEGMDWLFGHEEGDIKPQGVMSNPFSDPLGEKYEDSRKGALSKLWDNVTGKGDEEAIEEPVIDDASAKALKDSGVIGKWEDKPKEYAMFNSDPIDKEDEKTIKIVLEGDIKGMDEENQKEVSRSIVDYFNKQNSGLSSNFKYDLTKDQTRT